MTVGVPFEAMYDAIQRIDLLYQPECWKLCGDAHCCHFTRHKPPHARGHQEIPLLPGEWAYMQATGTLAGYPNARRTVLTFKLEAGPLRYESLTIRTDKCPCRHDTRPTVCRIYPLLPEFAVDGSFIGADKYMTIYEEVENLLEQKPACAVVDTVSPAEMDKLGQLASALAAEPVVMFHVMAYSRAKAHLRRMLAAKARSLDLHPGKSVSEAMVPIGTALLQGKLLDWSTLRKELDLLAGEFKAHYGPGFVLA